MELRRPYGLIIAALVCLGAAPSRTQTYTSGQVISPTAVTENEDNIFSYLQGGVDTYKTSSILAAAINAGSVGTAAIASNSIDGTKIAVGSDTQGDVLYYNGTDWARLAAGTSGQFLKTQGASANPVWASTSVSAISGSFTRDVSTASGTQSITVASGFKPVLVYFFGGIASSTESFYGVDDGTTANAVNFNDGSVADQMENRAGTSIYLLNGGSVRSEAKITSFDTNGFTLTWTKTGSHTGTATIFYWAIK